MKTRTGCSAQRLFLTSAYHKYLSYQQTIKICANPRDPWRQSNILSAYHKHLSYQQTIKIRANPRDPWSQSNILSAYHKYLSYQQTIKIRANPRDPWRQSKSADTLLFQYILSQRRGSSTPRPRNLSDDFSSSRYLSIILRDPETPSHRDANSRLLSSRIETLFQHCGNPILKSMDFGLRTSDFEYIDLMYSDVSVTKPYHRSLIKTPSLQDTESPSHQNTEFQHNTLSSALYCSRSCS